MAESPQGGPLFREKKLRPCSGLRVRQGGADRQTREVVPTASSLWCAPLTGAKTRRNLQVEARVKGKYLVLLVQLKAPGTFRRAGRHLDGLDCVEMRGHNCDYTIVPGEF